MSDPFEGDAQEDLDGLELEELEAYLDGSLAPDRGAKIAARLSDPGTQELLAELRADRELGTRLREVCAASTGPAEFAPTIAGYSQLEFMARGGQGAVFRAVQDSTGRAVALKVQSPFATEDQRQRFEREIDLVVGFSHPNLVPVFDRGVAAEGLPFFAMELVEGVPIDAFCAERRLGVPAILQLFLQVCRAVTYAHGRGVLHRDLKPANILVDTSGEPRVLDFGVARLVGADLATLTSAGQFTGTLAYAAPEQLGGDPLATDVRCDVHALGVILFELLTGSLPFDVDGSIQDAIRNVMSCPSRAPRRDGRPLPRDLETILGEALQKEPERRYASVADLARDVERFLAGDPIDARRDRRLYVASKLLRKHWLPVSAVGGVFVTLVAATLISWWFWQQTEAEAATTKDVNLFFASMLYEARPGSLGRDAKLLDVVEAVSDGVEERFADRPRVAEILHAALGLTYSRLDRNEESERHLRRALALKERSRGEGHPETLKLRMDLADVLRLQGKVDEALGLIDSVLVVRERDYGRDHPGTLRARTNRATLWLGRGQHERAVQEFARIVPKLEAEFGETSLAHLGALAAWASGLRRLDRLELAETIARRLVALRERVEGEGPNTQSARNTLAVILDARGNHEESVPLYERVYASRVELYGKDAPRTLTTLANLALALWDAGQRTECVAKLRSVREAYVRKLTMRHPASIQATHNLAHKLGLLGLSEEAAPLYAEAERMGRKHLRKTSFLRLVLLGRHAEFMLTQKRARDAVERFEEAFGGLEKVAKLTHPETRRAGTGLADALEASGDPARARAVRARLAAAQPDK